MDERTKFRMRFVGYDQEGKLMPRAPAFKKDEIRVLPLEYAQHPWWVLIEPVPDLVLPEAREEDSVFIEEIFVPREEGTESEESMPKGVEERTGVESGVKPVSSGPTDSDSDVAPGKEGSKDEKPHKCPVCGRDYKLKRNLKKHIKNKHPDWLAEQDAKKQVYRKMTVKELRNLIKELGGKVNYLHRKFEYIDYILRLKAEKEA